MATPALPIGAASAGSSGFESIIPSARSATTVPYASTPHPYVHSPKRASKKIRNPPMSAMYQSTFHCPEMPRSQSAHAIAALTAAM
jgi:hypothetical protein